MSDQITFDQAVIKIAELEKSLTEVKSASKIAMDDMDEDDKKQEASFKQAMEDMDKKDNEKKAMDDDHEKIKDAFKKAMDEKEPEKKKESMKKAMEMKEDEDKKARKAMDEPAPKEDINKQKEHEAKIASIVMKKIPLMQKILEATKIMNAPNYSKVEKQLEAATLEDVQNQYDTIKPYLAALGVGNQNSTPQGTMGMIPFQANAATQINTDNIFEGSVDSIDFSKVKTSQIMGMYK